MPVEIINSTPWDDEDLTRFFSPLCEGTGIATVNVGLLLAQPGTKRIDQPLYEVSGIDAHNLKKGILPRFANVTLISPKRAAARTDLLDRMAQIEDLAAHEIALPERITGGISHAFEMVAGVCHRITRKGHKRHYVGDPWEFCRHFRDERHRCCECVKTLKVYPFIRGNTKTRTAPPVDIKRLKRRGRWALESAEKHREKMEEQLALAQKLGRRIRKLEGR